MVMGHLNIAIKAIADAQTDVGALIAHRVFGIDTHQSALSILAIERALGTTQDIHTVEHIEMVIKGCFRHQGDIVVIEADGGTVDTRADATHIHRRGEARAIGRHHERRYILRQLTQVADIQLLELFAAKDITTHGLQTQTNLFLRLSHHNHFI